MRVARADRSQAYDCPLDAVREFVDVVHPPRSAEIERLGVQDLPEPRNREYAFGQSDRELVEVGHRSSKDSNGADRETYVAVGVLGLEEPRIQHRQLVHVHTVCRMRTSRERQRSRTSPRGLCRR